MALKSDDILLVQRGDQSYQMPASQLGAPDSEVSPDLQSVTDKGNTTTNGAEFGGEVLATGTSGYFKANRTEGTVWVSGSATPAVLVHNDGNQQTIALNWNGSASFSGNVDVGALDFGSTTTQGSRIRPEGIFNLQRPSSTPSTAEFIDCYYGNTQTFRVEVDGSVRVNSTGNQGSDILVRLGNSNNSGNKSAHLFTAGGYYVASDDIDGTGALANIISDGSGMFAAGNFFFNPIGNTSWGKDITYSSAGAGGVYLTPNAGGGSLTIYKTTQGTTESETDSFLRCYSAPDSSTSKTEVIRFKADGSADFKGRVAIKRDAETDAGLAIQKPNGTNVHLLFGNGNATFAENKISFVGSDGSASFASNITSGANTGSATNNADGTFVGSNGQVAVYKASASTGAFIQCTQSNGSGGFNNRFQVNDDGSASFDGAVKGSMTSITNGGAWNLKDSNFWTAAGGTLVNPTNVEESQTGVIYVAGELNAFGNMFSFPGGVTPTIPANSIVPYFVDVNNKIRLGLATEAFV